MESFDTARISRSLLLYFSQTSNFFFCGLTMSYYARNIHDNRRWQNLSDDEERDGYNDRRWKSRRPRATARSRKTFFSPRIFYSIVTYISITTLLLGGLQLVSPDMPWESMKSHTTKGLRSLVTGEWSSVSSCASNLADEFIVGVRSADWHRLGSKDTLDKIVTASSDAYDQTSSVLNGLATRGVEALEAQRSDPDMDPLLRKAADIASTEMGRRLFFGFLFAYIFLLPAFLKSIVGQKGFIFQAWNVARDAVLWALLVAVAVLIVTWIVSTASCENGEESSVKHSDSDSYSEDPSHISSDAGNRELISGNESDLSDDYTIENTHF